MKTFKMLSISILTEDGFQEFPLVDGIVINQENSHRMWVLELFIDAKYKEQFEKWKETKELLEARVVISYPDNEPAPFVAAVDALRQIGDRLSVLMKGRLERRRSKYAEHLLEELVDEGLGGDQLLTRFQEDMLKRPRLKRDQR